MPPRLHRGLRPSPTPRTSSLTPVKSYPLNLALESQPVELQASLSDHEHEFVTGYVNVYQQHMDRSVRPAVDTTTSRYSFLKPHVPLLATRYSRLTTHYRAGLGRSRHLADPRESQRHLDHAVAEREAENGGARLLQSREAACSNRRPGQRQGGPATARGALALAHGGPSGLQSRATAAWAPHCTAVEPPGGTARILGFAALAISVGGPRSDRDGGLDGIGRHD